MRRLMVTTAALALGACCHTAKPAPEAPVAPASEEETAMQQAEWQAPVMPTAEEAAKAAAEAQAAAEAGVVYAGYDKKGSHVALKVGETLRIELESIPTAGYVWSLGQTPAFMTPAGEGGRATDPAHQSLPGFTGGNHYLSFDFTAAAAGTGKFKLTEGRPWETDEPPTDTYELTVTVTE
ncbi:MAG: protease inhibitor I42 family protein [Hyphomonas sp.]